MFLKIYFDLITEAVAWRDKSDDQELKIRVKIVT